MSENPVTMAVDRKPVARLFVGGTLGGKVLWVEPGFVSFTAPASGPPDFKQHEYKLIDGKMVYQP